MKQNGYFLSWFLILMTAICIMAYAEATNYDRIVLGSGNYGTDPNTTADLTLQNDEYISNAVNGTLDFGAANITTTGTVSGAAVTGSGNLKALSIQVGTPTGTPASGSLQVQNDTTLRSTLNVDGAAQFDNFLFVGTPTMTPAAGSVGIQNNLIVGGTGSFDSNIQTDGRVMIGTPTGTPTPGDAVIQNSIYAGANVVGVTADFSGTIEAGSGNNVLTNATGLIDGEKIQDDTIDDDSIDFADVTGADLTLTDCGAVTTSALTAGTRLLVLASYSADPNAATAEVDITGLDADDLLFATQNTANSAYILSVVYSQAGKAIITWSADPNASVTVAIQAWED